MFVVRVDPDARGQALVHMDAVDLDHQQIEAGEPPPLPQKAVNISLGQPN